MKRQTPIFISYTLDDESFKQDLLKVLFKDLGDQITVVGDQKVRTGDERESLRKWAFQAEIVILLVSRRYLESLVANSKPVRSDDAESEIAQSEISEFLESLEAERIRILPILIDGFDVRETVFKNFLPLGANPHASESEKQNHFEHIIAAIKSIIELQSNFNAWEKLIQAKESGSKELNLSNLDLNYIPFDLMGMPNLLKLNLERNQISKIDHLDQLINLKELNLDSNRIQKIENLDRLQSLEVLNLVSNQIKKIENLQTLKNLKRLELRHNQIVDLRPIEQVKSLQVLGVSNNRISSLKGVEVLKNLEVLYASYNQIRAIDALSKLSKLRRIVLTSNKIESIKPLLPRIKKDFLVGYYYDFEEANNGLFISDNATLSEPSVEVIQQGTSAILKYFSDVDLYGVQKLEIVKMILVGNSRVGKTNLSQFLRTGTINPETNSTHLLDIQNWSAPFLKSEQDTLTKVTIFDFGGQDYYHDSHRLYYSHDTAYILLWEESTNSYNEVSELNPATGEELTFENFPLPYWLESIQYNLRDKSRSKFKDDKGVEIPQNPTRGVPILIIQNKIDQGEAQLDQNTLKQAYPMIWGFFNVSLSSGKRTGILEEILKDYFHALDLTGRKLVNYEMKVVRHFLEKPQVLSVLSLNEFLNVCEKLIDDPNLEFNLDNAEIIAQILSNSGILLFEKLEQGEGWIYTNIKEVNEIVKQIMDVARSGTEKGIFKRNQIQNIPNHQVVLGLLIRNKSIIEINNNEFLAPQFLPTEPDPFIRFFLPGFKHTQIRFVFKAFFHKTLMLNLFAKFLEKENIDTTQGIRSFPFWRNGIIVRRQGKDKNSLEMVYVEFTKTKDFGLIQIRTQMPFNRFGLEQEIVETLDELTTGWSVEKQMSPDSIHYFSTKEIIKEVNSSQFSFTHKMDFDNTDLNTWEKWKKEQNPSSSSHPPQRVFSAFDFKSLEVFVKLPKKIFISYSSKDSDFIRRFITHLEVLKANKILYPWYDRKIETGTRWDDNIMEEMNRADLIIFMLSPDFLATEYVMETEVPKAIELSNSGKKLFPIQLKTCGWDQTILSEFQQTDNSKETWKNVITVGTPDNDDKWNEIIKELLLKLEKM